MKPPPKYSEKAASLQLGLYEHYKGNRYEVTDVAFHSETLEEYVGYRPADGSKQLWIRPLKMFCETVIVEGGREVPRFRFIKN